MYVLPKGMESAWLTARGKGWVFRTGEFGEMIVSLDRRSTLNLCVNANEWQLTAIGMGMVMVSFI